MNCPGRPRASQNWVLARNVHHAQQANDTRVQGFNNRSITGVQQICGQVRTLTTR